MIGDARQPVGSALAELVTSRSDVRTRVNRDFFAAEAGRVAQLCHRVAERFARGGRLVAIGHSPQGRSDVRHVAVEFVHPVIVGKRALPAIGLAPEGGPLDLQVDLIAEPDDIVLAFGPETHEPDRDGVVAAALEIARSRGCLTVAFERDEERVGAEWTFVPPVEDPFVRQELVETLYHVLWELVHVFFEHRGLLQGRQTRALHDSGPSRFLDPFLAEGERDVGAVLEDVRRSVVMKAVETGALREQTLSEGRDTLIAAARSVRAAFERGGKLLAFGNGGSATDAMDLVADFRNAPQGWPPRRAMDLTEDPAILTAIANDVGHESIFTRQIIAYGRRGDVALGLSTSGSSGNVLAALGQARKQGLMTMALVGYDGGRVVAERLADHVVVTRSQHAPRIQEAQATACHVLRELVETVGDGAASGARTV